MPNVIGKTGTLTVLTPIIPTREEELLELLEGLQPGENSPFYPLANTHFARFVIVDGLVHDAPDQRLDALRSHYLLFTAICDGELEHYLESLCVGMIGTVHEIWSLCVGYPGDRDLAAVKAYFRNNMVDASLFFPAYGDATLAEVEESLIFRRRFTDFAVKAQDMDAGQLYREFRQTFGRARP